MIKKIYSGSRESFCEDFLSIDFKSAAIFGSFPVLKRNIVPTLLNLIPPEIIEKPPTDHFKCLELTNGSRVYFVSNPETFRGMTLDLIGFVGTGND